MLVLLAVIFGAAGSTQGSEAVARQLFEQYVALGHAYDARLADLYSDDAVIRNKRTYPTGEVRELTMPAARYKTLIREAMRVAKARGERNKNYTSPISLLVGPSAGNWLIYEEVSESRP